MDGATVQQKVFYGYAKAASVLGAPFNLYRASTPINPIQSGNLVGSILASANVSWSYLKANKFNNAVWQILIDAQASSAINARLFDYIVGTGGDNNTYYILSEQFLLPIQAVSCNRTLTIVRPYQPTTVGNVGYVGYQPSTSTAVVTAMPASVLQFRKGQFAKTNLPSDTNEPEWQILLPNIGNVKILVGDVITTEKGESFLVIGTELTDLGWRLIGNQIVNTG